METNETETKRVTSIALTDAERLAIERASGRVGYGGLRAGVLTLLAYWQDAHAEPQPEPEPVA